MTKGLLDGKFKCKECGEKERWIDFVSKEYSKSHCNACGTTFVQVHFDGWYTQETGGKGIINFKVNKDRNKLGGQDVRMQT